MSGFRVDRRLVGAAAILALLAVVVFWRQSGHVDHRRTYKIGFGDSPPVHFADESGRAAGLVVEIVRTAAQRRGIKLEWVHVKGGAEPALQSGTVDLWPLMTITPERKQHLHISDPFGRNIPTLVAREEKKLGSLRDLGTARIAFEGNPIELHELDLYAPRTQRVEGLTARQMLEGVCQGKLDAAYLSEEAIVTQLLAGVSCQEKLRMAQPTAAREMLGVGSTFAAAAVADELRSAIGELTAEGKLAPIFFAWSPFAARDLEAAEDLIRSRRREAWLVGGIGAAVALLLLAVWQSVRIRQQRNEARLTGQALHQAEQKLRLLANNIREMVWAYDMNRRLVYGNPAMQTITGFTPAELENEQPLCWVHPEDRSRMMRIWERVFDGESFANFEYRLQIKSGQERWVAASWGPIMDESGRQVGAQGTERDITHRIHAEEILGRAQEQVRLSEARYRAFVANSTEVVARVEFDEPIPTNLPPEEQLRRHHEQGYIAECNEAAARMFGYESSAQFTGARVLDLIGGTGKVLEPGVRFMTGGYKISEAETHLVDKTGAIRQLLFSATGIVDSGNLVRIWYILRDITERKAAQEALRLSEERLRILFEAAPDAWYLRDDTGHFAQTNRAMEELTGYPRSELHEVRVKDILRSMNAADDPEQLERTLEEPFGPAEYGVWKKDGRMAHVELRTFPVKIEGRQMALGCIRDMTERKRAERALRESEERFRQIAENSRDVFWLLDPTGFLYVSPAFNAIWGRPLEELYGASKRLIATVHPDDRPLVEGSMAESWTSAEERHVEYRIVRPDGSIRWINGRSFSVSDSSGRPYRSVGIAEDITERRQRDDELRALKSQLERENIQLREVIQSEQVSEDLVGESEGIRRVSYDVRTVAPTGATVLVLGETGTGKELVARAVHGASQLKDKPLITVNCAALSAGLIESEFFGHEKGAFTGAVARKRGRFELADGGTIFLDEIGDLPLDLQAKLLRVLQDGEFERVGGTQTLKVNVRVIAATNRDLQQAAAAGTFRPDLYYRLNVFPIRVPPLRDRRGDIPLLVGHFLSRFSRTLGKPLTSVTARSLDMLINHDWPGNVRELVHIIERAAIRASGAVVNVEEYLLEVPAAAAEPNEPLASKLEDLERSHLVKLLAESNWVIEGDRGAAARMGVHPNTLRYRMRKLGIIRPARPVG